MNLQQHLLDYTLRLGDNALILSQRLGEWCGHGPVLEQDIALTNIALDLLGQARMLGERSEKVRSACVCNGLTTVRSRNEVPLSPC